MHQADALRMLSRQADALRMLPRPADAMKMLSCWPTPEDTAEPGRCHEDAVVLADA